MTKFIAVHREGTETLFNIEKIICVVYVNGGGCGFVVDGNSPFFVDETYDEVRRIIGNAKIVLEDENDEN